MVTTKQEPTVDSQKIKTRKSKHTTIENKFTQEGSKRGRKEQGKYKATGKQWDGSSNSLPIKIYS